jgi:DNA/RNA-binding domain of Phe-tRNA-synthetase-like protein
MHIEMNTEGSLYAGAFMTRFPRPLGEIASPAALTRYLAADAAAPLEREEAVRRAVRDMLRAGGYRPTGRGKPAAEYLVRAAAEGGLPSINAAVDACNVVSLHSGLPISVIDLDRAAPPFRIAVARAADRYVFNRAGQEIELAGLPCVFDASGPCANAVKDSQRTKTDETTTVTLSVLWGPRSHATRVEQAERWYRELLQELGAATEDVGLT